MLHSKLKGKLETKRKACKTQNNKKIRQFLNDMQHSALSILSLIITNSILVHSCRLRATRIHLNHRIKYLNWHHHSIVHARISLFNTAFVVFFFKSPRRGKQMSYLTMLCTNPCVCASKFRTVNLSETLGQNYTSKLNTWERTIRSWQRFAVMQSK